MGQTITLPAIAAMAPVARCGIAGLLAGADRHDDAVLIATELVTRAIRASVGDVVIRVHDLNEIRIEVTDQRGRHPRLDTILVEDDAPYGLAIVSALADEIGSVRHRSGDCTMWALLRPLHSHLSRWPSQTA
ncbi:ATP-binding protein [Salinactinospora qingdaonensis]|uniref:ATP-binding protein n=1 Tax=Salinactinospora qingdaonensis TaxID=702744 RepID=UPI0031E7BA9F